MSERDIWQEYECPLSSDFDLDGDLMVYEGQAFQCSGCGLSHVAGRDVQVCTAEWVDGVYRGLSLPRTADELAALRTGAPDPDCLKNRQDRGSFLAPLEAGNSSRALGLLRNLPKGVK